MQLLFGLQLNQTSIPPPIHQPVTAAPWPTTTKPTLQTPGADPTSKSIQHAFKSTLKHRLETSADPPSCQPDHNPLQAGSATSLHRTCHVRAPIGLMRLIWRPYDMDKRQRIKAGGNQTDGWTDLCSRNRTAGPTMRSRFTPTNNNNSRAS